jgi:hypothetical protein
MGKSKRKKAKKKSSRVRDIMPSEGVADTVDTYEERIQRRSRVRMQINLSPVLMAGDVLVLHNDWYIKEGEKKREVLEVVERGWLLRRFIPAEKVHHPNCFLQQHVEALPHIFKPIS